MDPSAIEPVRTRKGRYGKVKEAVSLVVLEAAPLALPTLEIAFRVAEKLEMRFVSAAEYKTWAKNAINRDLHRKWTEGTVERFQIPGEETRWKAVVVQRTVSLDELRMLK